MIYENNLIPIRGNQVIFLVEEPLTSRAHDAELYQFAQMVCGK
jgi:hypothetical protein